MWAFCGKNKANSGLGTRQKGEMRGKKGNERGKKRIQKEEEGRRSRSLISCPAVSCLLLFRRVRDVVNYHAYRPNSKLFLHCCNKTVGAGAEETRWTGLYLLASACTSSGRIWYSFEMHTWA